MKKAAIAVFLLMLCCAVPAFAVDAPLFSLKRLQIGVRTEYQGWKGQHSDVLQFMRRKEEFASGITGAYQLMGGRALDGTKVPTLSLTYRLTYGWDSKLYQNAIGLNLRIYNGYGD